MLPDEAMRAMLQAVLANDTAAQLLLLGVDNGPNGKGPKPPLNDDGGGDKFDSMEPRVAALEAHMEHVRDDLAKLAAVPTRLATLETKVDHLPGKGFVVTAGIGTVTALTAILIALQHLGVLH